MEKLGIVGMLTIGVCAILVILAVSGLMEAGVALGACLVGGVGILAMWGHLYMKPRSYERGPVRPLVRRNPDATISAPVRHVEGLPLGQDENVTMYYEPGRVVFRREGREVVISRGFISRIERCSGKDFGLEDHSRELLVLTCMRSGRAWPVVVDTSGAGAFAARVERDFASPPSHITANSLEY